MTNEKAAKLLKSIEILAFRDKAKKYFMKDVNEAINIAIKALEATEQVNTSHNGVQMFPKGTFKAVYDNESVISTKVVTDYIKSHIHEIISESGRDLNEHTNQVLRTIIKDVEGYQESEGKK